MTQNPSNDQFGRPIKALNTENETSQADLQDHYGRIDQPIQGSASEFIEENKRLKQEIIELKKSSEILRSILLNAPINVIVRDAEGRCLLINPQYEIMTGLSAEDALGKTPHDLFDGDTAEKITQYDRQVLESGESMQTETTYVINNEERTFLSVRAPLMDSKNKPFAVCMMGTDITDQKNVERALRESENRYRRITESITDFIFTVDVRNSRLQESVHSSACIAITGYNREEFKADPSLWSRLVHMDDRSLVQDLVRRVLEGEDVSAVEHRIIRKDKQVRWVKNTLVPHYDEYGALQSYDNLIRDITEQKLAEEETKRLQTELQQAQKMEAIGTLAGGIAHDFNNILSIIVGNVELALLNIPEDSKARQNLERSFTASMRARDLIKQILVFSRQSEKKLMPCDIRPVIKESIRLLRAFIPSSIEIRQSIPSKIDTIRTDPTHINQVLINLSSNAAHAMRKDGGVLEIRLENTKIDENTVSTRDLKPGRYVKLSVSDTGTGMTPDIMDKIFDPYFTTKKAGEGTGMGLAVVHGILKKHGGGIAVSSSVGKGTVFDMYFPCIDKTSIKEQKKTQMKISRGNERILFVDDEEAVVQMAREMLEQFGYQVIIKTDSMEAFRIFREDPSYFDLLLTDQTMPKLTGVNLAQKVMEIRPDIPVILSTGYSDMIDKNEINASGIRGFIKKPFVIAELTQKIRSVLDSE